jgi:hypothetical protein
MLEIFQCHIDEAQDMLLPYIAPLNIGYFKLKESEKKVEAEGHTDLSLPPETGSRT